jgi:hypothetical protein
MKTVYKYEIEPKELQEINLPIQSKILSVAEQEGELYLWAEIDLDNHHIEEPRTLRIAGTGWTLEDGENRKFIGTAHMPKQKLVWHVYEVLK